MAKKQNANGTQNNVQSERNDLHSERAGDELGFDANDSESAGVYGDDLDSVGDGEERLDDDGGSEGVARIPPWIASAEGGAEFQLVDSEQISESDREAERQVLKLVAATGELEDKAEDVRRLEPSLVKRAASLFKLGVIDYPDMKPARSGDMIVMSPMPTDENRWALFNHLFTEDERPHLDAFRGRLIDHRGIIIDERYSVVELVKTCGAAQLKGLSAETVRRSFKEWALSISRNDLIEQFQKRIPEWDQKARMPHKLIGMFGCRDTALNRRFSTYFWMSLYCRIMHPGCFAPMVLALFGAQNSGKSYLGKRISQLVTGNPKADSIKLDLSSDWTNFLREITGQSVIANVGEMTGFNRGDLNKIKDFITRTGDPMHFKFEGHYIQDRQWVVVMDGNKYEGLQRDDTGNRRIYPMFVGQLDDKKGQPAWREKFEADFKGFEEDFWQIMSECRAWLASSGGIDAYEEYVKEVIREVAEFSNSERRADRGTIRDEDLDDYLPVALRNPKIWAEVNGSVNKGMFIPIRLIRNRLTVVSKGTVRKTNHLPTKMSVLGCVPKIISGERGYYMPDVRNYDEVKEKLDLLYYDPDDDTKLGVIDEDEEGEGF